MLLSMQLAILYYHCFRPFQIDKLFIGLPSQNLGSVGRLKKENRNMNIISVGNWFCKEGLSRKGP